MRNMNLDEQEKKTSDHWEKSLEAHRKTVRAGRWILEIAIDLQLTVHELDKAVEYAKENAYLSSRKNFS